MPRLVTLASTPKQVTMPNGIRYAGGATVYLSDEEYSLLSNTFKATFTSDVFVGSGSAAPSVVRLEDGLTSNLATVAQFHNADNQQPGATAFGLLTGGVAQLLNVAGNIDRQRETGQDSVPAVGIATGGAQFAMAFLTTDSADNFAAGTRTFTPLAMSGTIQGVPWSIQPGSILSMDSAANQEFVVVTATAATTFTAVTAKAHNGTTTPFTISGFVYNQERDASGELDGATGSGTAIAAEYEYNAGGAGNSNFDRARNLQGKGLSAAGSWTGTISSGSSTFTASAAPTNLQPGQPIFFYTTATGAITEVVYTALNYQAGTTSIILKSNTVSNHNSATESFRYDIYAPAGPILAGFLPTGIGIEEEALYDPVSGLFYIERAATQDGVSTQNVVMENPALINAAGNADRGRAGQFTGSELVSFMPATAALTETSSTTAAGGAINATVPAVAAKTSYITGFDVTLGSGTAGVVTVTVTGITNQLNYVAVTLTAGLTLLSIRFPQPIPATAVNTAVTVSLPASGGASAVNTVNVFGFQN